MLKRVKILAKLWLVYFMFSIVLIGIFFSGMIFYPLYILEKAFPGLQAVREKALYYAVRLLMWMQPWYKATVEIDVPQDTRGILIVSNHRSHLDVFVLLSRIPGIRVLAKSSLFKIPGLSAYMRASQQIRVERGSLQDWVAAMNQVGERLGRGERVHVFPELTRCEPGFRGLKPFAAGPFQEAIKQGVSVLPVVFENTDGVWPKGKPGISFREPIVVRSLAPLEAKNFSNAFELRDEVSKRIEQALS